MAKLMENSFMADASPTYRGFRKQFLYILWRILCDDNNDSLVYQPEKIEDLAIFEQTTGSGLTSGITNKALVLKELIQVKDYSEPLTFSDFNPHSDDSFFHRIKKELKHRDINISIASYGEFGTELDNALNGRKTEKVLEKLIDAGIANDIAAKIIEKTDAVMLEEEKLETEIINKLSEGPASPDPENTFDLLMKWMYDCCEQRQLIQKEDVQTKINSIGTYISERKTHSAEWGVTLASLQEQLDHKYDKTKLVDEYLEGMDATLLHIHAGCDVIRKDLLNEINEKISNSNIVIIHGASGQGKSTLAYRYIYDYYPISLCYEVKNITDSQHALSIARAISGYSKGCGEILLYIDIKPGWSGWETLLADLRHCNNIKVLVTIREEELHIANLSSEFLYKDILLEFTEDEAKRIYQTIPSRQISGKISSFEEAWQRFGGTGPLLEFIHLVTHGGKLEERIRAQIDRIHDGIISGKRSSTEIDILRLVSVASAFGASCNSYELMKYLGINSIRFFHKLQDEYLIKKDGDYITGLHSIRSEKILALLCDTQKAVTEAVCECISLIASGELYLFLLHTFTRCPNNLTSILNKINSVEIKNWSMAQNILDALLWLGVKKYVEKNSTLLDDVYKRFKSSPASFIDLYVADKNQSKVSMFELMKDHLPEGGVEEMQSFINRQTDKSRILLYCKKWLNKASFIITDTFSKDFSSIGKICFWAARAKKLVPVDQGILDLFLKEKSSLTIDFIANFIIGIYNYNEDYFKQIVQVRDEIIKKYKEETYILRFEEAEDSIKIHYLLPLKISEDYDSIVSKDYKTADLNDESVFRINILRKIFPDKKVFMTEGYGQNIINIDSFDYYHDDTKKEIPIENLYIDWETNINAVFCNLAYWQFRSKDWKEYSAILINQRKEIISEINTMCQIAAQSLSSKDYAFLNQLSIQFLEKDCIKYPIPQCAVDEWGFSGESIVDDFPFPNKNIATGTSSHLYNQKFKKYCSTYGEYVRTWSNIKRQFESTIAFSIESKISERNRENEQAEEEIIFSPQDKTFIKVEKEECSEDEARIATVCMRNIVDFIKNINLFQTNFSKLFEKRFLLQDLRELEQEENSGIACLFGFMQIAINTPSRRLLDPVNYVSRIDSVFEDLIRKIERKLAKNSNSQKSYCLYSWESSKQLWIVADSNDIEDFAENLVYLKSLLGTFIESLSPLNKLLLEIHFSEINIVNLYKGKLLFDTFFSYDVIMVLIDGFANLADDIAIKVLDDEKKSCLSLESYNSEIKNIAVNYIEINNLFYTILMHLSDIHRLKECDDDMMAFISDYIQQILVTKNPIQELLDNTEKISDIFNEINDDDLINNPLLSEAISSFVEWHKIGIEPFLDEKDNDQGITKEISSNMISEWKEAYHDAYVLGNTAAFVLTAASIE